MIQHAEERPCMTALLHARRLCECREPVTTEVLSGSPLWMSEFISFLLLNVNPPLGVASPRSLPVFYLAVIQPLRRPCWNLGARASSPCLTQHPGPFCAVAVVSILPLPAGGVRCPLSSKASLLSPWWIPVFFFFSEGFVTDRLRIIWFSPTTTSQ